MFFIQASLQIGPGVDAGGGVSLEEDEVTVMIFIWRVKEVVESNLEQGGNRGVAGNMSTESIELSIRLYHHGHGVPADDGFYTSFNGVVAGFVFLCGDGDGVYICSVGTIGQVCTGAPGLIYQSLQYIVGTFNPCVL